MTKERLEELIKQEAEIYVVENKHIFKYQLKKKARPILCSDVLYIVSYDIPYEYPLDQTFETETDAEKEIERQVWKEKVNAERIERFEPPMWEEIKDTYEFHFTCQNYTHKRTDGIIETVYTPQCFMFYVHKSEQPNYNRVMIRNYRIYAINIEVFDEPATKENYERACEIVRDLFGGEK